MGDQKVASTNPGHATLRCSTVSTPTGSCCRGFNHSDILLLPLIVVAVETCSKILIDSGPPLLMTIVLIYAVKGRIDHTYFTGLASPEISPRATFLTYSPTDIELCKMRELNPRPFAVEARLPSQWSILPYEYHPM